MAQCGYPENEVLEKLDEIDIGHITQQGFSKERYPFSLIKTYHHYCKEAGSSIDRKVEKRIADIGWKVFRQVPEQVEGAERVLENLQKRYLLLLATLGDPEVQDFKLNQSRLKTYFSAIYVLRYKTVEEYRKIIQRHHLKKEDTWLIGNSVRSDLNPGLKLGLNCILIPAATWKFEEEKPVSNQYIQVDTLPEILNYLS